MFPLGMLDTTLSVDNSFFWPGTGCWFGSTGMLFVGSRTSWALSAGGPSTRWLYTLYTAFCRIDSGTGQLDSCALAEPAPSLLCARPMSCRAPGSQTRQHSHQAKCIRNSFKCPIFEQQRFFLRESAFFGGVCYCMHERARLDDPRSVISNSSTCIAAVRRFQFADVSQH